MKRVALRFQPAELSPLVAIHQGGASGGAARGAKAVDDSFHFTGRNFDELALLPFALAAGAIVGAMIDHFQKPSPIGPVSIQIPDQLEGEERFYTMLQELEIELVDPNIADDELKQDAFDAVIDVRMFAPVISGRRSQAKFSVLYKMEIQPFRGQFAERTWYREHISKPAPLDEWSSADGALIYGQMVMIRLILIQDLRRLFS